MFGAVCAADGSSTEILIEVAREFSPRIEMHGPRAVTIDLSGLTRLCGDGRAMSDEVVRVAAARGLRVRVAIAGTRTAARLLAADRTRRPRDVIVVEPGTEAAAVAALPLDRLAVFASEAPPALASSHPGVLATFHRWGLRTLGDVAALPAAAVAARLGQAGVRWQRLARGEDPRPLLPDVPEERFEQALDLEWPIEGLEPLSFVLSRLLEPVSAQLERRGRSAVVLRVRLHLVTRAVHERALQLPAPMREARTLRTLALLDLESHPPSAAIDRVVVAVDPTPARVLQYSLLARPLPSPEQLSTLMARLTALMGEGRCGSPSAVETWQPGAFAMKRFDPGIIAPGTIAPRTSDAVVALRRFRLPIPVQVRVERRRPVRVLSDRCGVSGGSVQRCAGPWRTAGDWWAEGAWDRDEWDVTLSDGATCRLFRDRRSDAWFLEGIVD